ncbi:hypothetical protein [Ralstonia wenshanensis]|uniref:Uncharacterized protein n=1 Tax=Ralstonia wenshanensis TaxID=2842456 RepID=A0AAD2EVS3_9RALS|nr:hypothetical protein [Ralstonia wenshanensis]CAJ0705412.1 hypothetical protein LMG18091_04432 [Ralstonia wenshanensis]
MQLHGGDIAMGVERGGGAAERAQGDCAQQQRAAQPVRNGLREGRPRRARADVLLKGRSDALRRICGRDQLKAGTEVVSARNFQLVHGREYFGVPRVAPMVAMPR